MSASVERIAPSPVADFAGAQVARIDSLTGGRVRIDPVQVLDRSQWVPLQPPTRISPNGSCRLVRAADAWLAVNLPRAADRELLPAWIQLPEDANDQAIDGAVARRLSSDLLDGAALLGLAVARVGEASANTGPAYLFDRLPRPSPAKTVVDLSTLWAGPLCAAVLAASGMEVLKIDSLSRPDPVRSAAPEFDAALNGDKRRLSIDFGDSDTLLDMISSADILVTSARPRAFAALGLSPERVLARNPHLSWVAITAHGWARGEGMRVGFGDDCAAAGGLVGWKDGEPHFLGDALADPLTGLAAAVAALQSANVGGTLIDVSLAGTAAAAALS